MPEAYSEMDVLVLPSRSTDRWTEQFGRVLVEALWCGVPIVGSDSGEIPWTVRATGGGCIFPEGDIQALARILSELRRSPAHRQTLVDRGREGARSLFGLDAAARALEGTLETALARRTGPGPHVAAAEEGPGRP
jgi:glycosyltransferase involved in cell wall biosynthesis